MSFVQNFSPLRGEVFYLKPRSQYIASEKGKTPAGKKRKRIKASLQSQRPAALVAAKPAKAAEERYRDDYHGSKG